ncbi:NAD-dependent epimerase/dehydratase family protein [Alkalihalobacillus pseudalcaliphilus]|uniref:NAD-dependent epimerase/dehydratase family protein n=1 Tax=Alkalihalobacillus pseudalcaliphilus TaxID=79884 RepID=UPI00064E053A|nr:NAD-dependent epimerase/dehydratase family protein [Alkalihalobacillus pseudalcaliphilus]KMK77329.1 epimerase [Alkalihalobacillus pseudalcaliphilus]
MNQLQNETIFITGGAGFIGSKLIEKLLPNNKIIVFDNFFRNSLRYKDYMNDPNITIVKGDILHLEDIQQSLHQATYIVHAAGIAGIDTVTQNPINTMKVNMLGTLHVLEAASKLSQCKKVICFSTSEVYGQRAFRSSEHSEAVLGAVGEARWTYAVSKLASEHLAYSYYKQLGLPTVILRPFNIYGPGQVGEGAIKLMVEKALKNQPIYIHGNGTQIRAWCYVDDMVDAIYCALVNDSANGESFNIGNEKAITTINELAQTIIRVLQSKSSIQHIDNSTADIQLRIPDIKKAKELLHFEAKIDLEEGIRRTSKFIERENT